MHLHFAGNQVSAVVSSRSRMVAVPGPSAIVSCLALQTALILTGHFSGLTSSRPAEPLVPAYEPLPSVLAPAPCPVAGATGFPSSWLYATGAAGFLAGYGLCSLVHTARCFVSGATFGAVAGAVAGASVTSLADRDAAVAGASDDEGSEDPVPIPW
jgi:hypothetical protein